MKTKSENRNIEKYKLDVKQKSDRELLEEKAYFNFATYRVLERIHTILYVWFVLSLLGIAIFFFSLLVQ